MIAVAWLVGLGVVLAVLLYVFFGSRYHQQKGGLDPLNARKKVYAQTFSFLPKLTIFVLIFGSLFVGVSVTYSYYQSDTGQQKMADWWSGVWNDYGPAWLQRQATSVVTFDNYGTEDQSENEKMGLLFNDFEVVGQEIWFEGLKKSIRLRFDVDLNKVDEIENVELICEHDNSDYKGNKIDIPVIEIPSLDKLTKRDLSCVISGDKAGEMEGTVKIEGRIKFPFVTAHKDGLLIVFAMEGEDVEEPSLAEYYGEPVEVALGFKDNPFYIREGYESPAVLGITLKERWEGEANITDIYLRVPSEAEIDETYLKSAGCPFEFWRDSNLVEREVYKIYKLDQQLVENWWGDLRLTREKPTLNFECPTILIGESVLNGLTDISRSYRATVRYDYETLPKYINIQVKPKPSEKQKTEETK